MFRSFFQTISKQTKSSQQLSALVVILVIAVVGTIVLTGSHAATPFASTSAHSGTLAGGAASQTCSGANDGSCVVFTGTGTGGGGGSGTADLYIATTGHDTGTCTQAAPCLSFDYAEQQASPGDTVQVAGGTYNGQTINDHGKTGADVTFTPAPNATVTLNGNSFIYASHIIWLGAVTNSTSMPPVTNFATKSVTIGNNDQTPGRPNATDVTLQNITGRNFEIDSATSITVAGGSWGPASACGGPVPGNNNSIRQTIPTNAPTDITIDNTVIHDIQSYDLVGCHIEGLAIFAGNRVTVSNSKFYGNSIYDIFMQANSGGSPDNVTIKNNWLAAALDNSGANGKAVGTSDGIALGGELSKDITIDGNHFNDILNLNDDGSIGNFSNVTVKNNYGMMAYAGYPCNTALPGIAWSNNVWKTNVKCGSTDTVLNGAALPYVNHNNDSTLNYTITP